MLTVSGLNLFSTKQNIQNKQMQQNPAIRLHSQPKSDTVSFGTRPKEQVQILESFISSLGKKFRGVNLYQSRSNKYPDAFISRQSFSLADLEELATKADKKIPASARTIKHYYKESDMDICIQKARLLKEKSKIEGTPVNNLFLQITEKIDGEFEYPEEFSKDICKKIEETGKSPFVIQTDILGKKSYSESVPMSLFSSTMQKLIDMRLSRGNGQFIVKNNKRSELVVTKAQDGLMIAKRSKVKAKAD